MLSKLGMLCKLITPYKNRQGYVYMSFIPILMVVFVGVLAFTLLPSMLAGSSVSASIARLENDGSYVVLTIDQYNNIVSILGDIRADEVATQSAIDIVEVHLHSPERWMGVSANQSGDDWGLQEGLAPFRAISGNGAYGSDLDDEAKVMGVDDTPYIALSTKFDVHRISVTAASVATDYVLRVVWGTGTMADAVAAGQYSNFMIQEAKKGVPVSLQMPRLDSGVDKVWVQAKNATNDATIDFFVGVHEYVE